MDIKMDDNFTTPSTAPPESSCDLYAHHSTARILMPLHYSIVFIIGLVGNLLALIVIVQNRKKINSTTLYSTNLVISDILFTTALPTRIAYYALGFDWRIGEALCRITALVFYINTYAGVNFMTCLSIDRFFAVVHPLRYNKMKRIEYAKGLYHQEENHCNHLYDECGITGLNIYNELTLSDVLLRKSADRYMAIVQPKYAKELKNTCKAVLACVGVWIMTLTTTIPLLLLYEDPDKASTPATCLKISDIVHLKAINVLNFTRLIFFFLIPLFIMIGCYLVIIHSLLHGKTSKLKPKVKEKSIRIIITLMVQVLVCFMPFHICFAFLMLAGDDHSYNPWGAFTTFLMNLSTCLDVILYYIVSKQFQARVISVMLYRNYLRSVRRKSFRSGSLRSLSNINSEML
ncbi:hypothetical protein HPG69_009639 [Diceros bicornis minor]|uniref:G-protein coupled receptors family 1 profile domain-containing protein n=1 Tax=Diceros bicornis minor TaxID=77932 RepID=A0A7J7EX88_DICBM|nr:hypothetical protein HPG69_009639 [Diceros bicornis minor]